MQLTHTSHRDRDRDIWLTYTSYKDREKHTVLAFIHTAEREREREREMVDVLIKIQRVGAGERGGGREGRREREWVGGK